MWCRRVSSRLEANDVVNLSLICANGQVVENRGSRLEKSVACTHRAEHAKRNRALRDFRTTFCFCFIRLSFLKRSLNEWAYSVTLEATARSY